MSRDRDRRRAPSAGEEGGGGQVPATRGGWTTDEIPFFEHRRARGSTHLALHHDLSAVPAELRGGGGHLVGGLAGDSGGDAHAVLSHELGALCPRKAVSVGRETTTANFHPRPRTPSHLVLVDVQASELLKLLRAGGGSGAAAKGGAGENGAGVAQHVVSGNPHPTSSTHRKNRPRYIYLRPNTYTNIPHPHDSSCEKRSSSSHLQVAGGPSAPFFCAPHRCISLGVDRLHEILHPQPALDVLPVTPRETPLVDEHRPPEPELDRPHNVIPARRRVALSLEV